MAPSAFLERNSPPDEPKLVSVLGEVHALWKRLRHDLAREYAPLTEVWTWSGRTGGWLLKLSSRQRTLVYLIPGESRFMASFALGESACAAAAKSGLPAPLLQNIATAPRFVEGRGVRIVVHEAKDLAGVLAVAALKMEN
jgi:hypothetical protein